MTDGNLRNTLISLVKKYASSGINSAPFPDRYDSGTGLMAAFVDRTVVGGHFALVRYLTSSCTRDEQGLILLI